MKPETRWKILAVLALVCAGWLAFSWWAAARDLRRVEGIVDDYAAELLELREYRPGKYDEPKIPDAPPGTKPVLRVEGEVRYPPMRGGSEEVGESGVTTAPPVAITDPRLPSERAIDTVPCSLDDLDVRLDCTVDALATPSKPWAKLVMSGTISAWGQTRDLPPTPAGTIHLEVAPSVVPPTWHMDALAGVAAGARFGLEAGATWTGRSRLGPYLLVEWQPAVGSSDYYSSGDPATWRIHAGLRVRIR